MLLNDTDIIIDDGVLRPLLFEEQEVLIKALIDINNPEMLFIFLISLLTGARLQTVLTLREENFERYPGTLEYIIKIKIGGKSNIDTKYNKSNIIYIPRLLYLNIKNYLNSERYKNRATKFNIKNEQKTFRYVFLTNRGIPYYTSKKDKNNYWYRKAPNGGTVRTFISNELKPILKKYDSLKNFKFHDLRASFGMNFIDENMPDVIEGKISITQLMSELMQLMGHSEFRTTERYLNYRTKHQDKKKKEYRNKIESKLLSYLKNKNEPFY